MDELEESVWRLFDELSIGLSATSFTQSSSEDTLKILLMLTEGLWEAVEVLENSNMDIWQALLSVRLRVIQKQLHRGVL